MWGLIWFDMMWRARVKEITLVGWVTAGRTEKSEAAFPITATNHHKKSGALLLLSKSQSVSYTLDVLGIRKGQIFKNISVSISIKYRALVVKCVVMWEGRKIKGKRSSSLPNIKLIVKFQWKKLEPRVLLFRVSKHHVTIPKPKTIDIDDVERAFKRNGIETDDDGNNNEISCCNTYFARHICGFLFRENGIKKEEVRGSGGFTHNCKWAHLNSLYTKVRADSVQFCLVCHATIMIPFHFKQAFVHPAGRLSLIWHHSISGFHDNT